MRPKTLESDTPETTPPGRRRRISLAVGIIIFLLLLILPAPGDMPPAAWRVVAVAVLMAFWWVTEGLPVAATALLPIVLFPLLGVASMKASTAPYADPVIFLFLGGLVLGIALQKSGLHRRMALRIVSWVGTKPANLVLGSMAATAFISMWVSNTATAAMMLPVAVSLVTLLIASPEAISASSREDRNLALCLLLGIAFAASIGGLGTLIGTPPNALFAAFMRQTYDIEISFAAWMLIGVPTAALLLFGTWLILTRIIYPVSREEHAGIRERLREELATLGPLSKAEKRVAFVFVVTAAAWMFRPLLAQVIPGLDDTGIAIAATLALFIISAERGAMLITWNAAVGLPWGVLLLFGGGLSLAAAMSDSGLADWIGAQLVLLQSWPPIVFIVALILITIALSELASNTATAAAFLPLVASIADGLGLAPMALTVPVTLAASCGFMLPVATPPNALFYGSGYVTVAQMAKAGALVDLLGAALVLAATYGLAGLAFGL